MNHHSLLRSTVMVLVLSSLLLSCASSSRYVSSSEPLRLPPCPIYNSREDLRFSSLGAITLALKDRGWVINKIDANNGVIEAEVWRLEEGQKHADSVIRVTVDDTGTLTIIRISPLQLTEDHAAHLGRWLSLLEKPYRSYNCRSIADLRNLLSTAGFLNALQPVK